MACCLKALNHYLNQCWHIVNNVPWHSSGALSWKDLMKAISKIRSKIAFWKSHLGTNMILDNDSQQDACEIQTILFKKMPRKFSSVVVILARGPMRHPEFWISILIVIPTISNGHISLDIFLPEICGYDFKCSNTDNLGVDILSIQVHNSLEWRPEDLANGKSTLVQVMVWCRLRCYMTSLGHNEFNNLRTEDFHTIEHILTPTMVKKNIHMILFHTSHRMSWNTVLNKSLW